MKLFVIYVGGKTHNSYIEVHDMRFGVGNVLQDCYEDIKKQWWGTEASLHVDCWAELHYADGFDIELKEYPYEGADEDDDIVRSGRVAGVEEVVGGPVHFAVAAGGDTDGRALFFEVVERFRIDGRELAGAEAADRD